MQASSVVAERNKKEELKPSLFKSMLAAFPEET
jgi:hypothetical protein